MHASVYTCFLRLKKRSEAECTPLLAKSLEKEAYSDIKYAVKIVKDDDNEKLLAHKAEFEILNKLSHNNVVRSIEIFNNELKSEIH